MAPVITENSIVTYPFWIIDYLNRLDMTYSAPTSSSQQT